MTLFLKWLLFNVASIIGLVGAYLAFPPPIHGTSLLMVPLVLLVALGTSIFNGILCWRTDKNAEKPEILIHDAEHVFFFGMVLQLLGLIGATVGYLVVNSAGQSNEDIATKAHTAFSGLALGLTATIIAVICSLLLLVQHHYLTHAIIRKQLES